jgi:hypothetical protein
LVNISAVGTSITLILMPVSFSHCGPEKFSGSSDWRPASHTTLISLPEYFFAASTARSAAVSALAGAAALAATSMAAARLPTKRVSVIPPSSGKRRAYPVLALTEAYGIVAVKKVV